MTTLIIIFLYTNLIGLIPYVFRISSHLILPLTIGLPLWLALIMSRLFYNPKIFLANYVPSGAPSILAPPLALIEIIRALVRPITLSLRLAANISAGHIVLTLVGSYLTRRLFTSIPGIAILISIQAGYTLFEVGICLIQAYIFCLLLSLYADEHPTVKL